MFARRIDRDNWKVIDGPSQKMVEADPGGILQELAKNEGNLAVNGLNHVDTTSMQGSIKPTERLSFLLSRLPDHGAAIFNWASPVEAGLRLAAICPRWAGRSLSDSDLKLPLEDLPATYVRNLDAKRIQDSAIAELNDSALLQHDKKPLLGIVRERSPSGKFNSGVKVALRRSPANASSDYSHLNISDTFIEDGGGEVTVFNSSSFSSAIHELSPIHFLPGPVIFIDGIASKGLMVRIWNETVDFSSYPSIFRAVDSSLNFIVIDGPDATCCISYDILSGRKRSGKGVSTL